MIKEYNNGIDFLNENVDFLNQNRYMTSLFFVDAKVLNEVSKINYAFISKIEDKTMVAIRVEPYNMLVYGDYECLDEIIKHAKNKEYVFNGIMCSSDIGEYLVNNYNYKLTLGMDFMTADKYTEESSKDVLCASIDDADEIYELCCNFVKDCGLPDIPNKEKISKNISNYRIYKEDGKIISMAHFYNDIEESCKITYVYTRPEYRGKGYARKVVNNIKNEILDMGKIATLNVDQMNPISNQLYNSLGFKKVFSQGIYLKESKV